MFHLSESQMAEESMETVTFMLKIEELIATKAQRDAKMEEVRAKMSQSK